MYIWRFIWSQGHQGCSALSLIRQKLSALSKSVSISFQCIWGTHPLPPPVLCCSPVKPECQVYQGRYSLRGRVVVVCVWRELQQACAAAATATSSVRGTKSLPILSKANCIISFWHVCRLADPASPFHCPEVQICSLVPGPLPHNDTELKDYFPLSTYLRYVSCEKS